MFDDIDIFVLTHNKKKPITLECLYGLDYTVYNNPDWNLPANYKPKDNAILLKEVRKQNLGQFRCFRGHQEILKMAKKDRILVFEDDAIPNNSNWKEIVKSSSELLDRYEVVSLHSREPKIGFKKKDSFLYKGNKYFSLCRGKFGYKWGLGTLCYLMHRNKKHKLTGAKYTGVPIDLYLMTHFQSCILQKTCFDHINQHNSLIRVKRKKKK